jgi:hypothetical protein
MAQDLERALSTLTRVELPRDLEVILGIESPDPEALNTLGRRELGPVVSHLASTMADLLDPEYWSCAVGAQGSSAARLGRAAKILVAYFVRCGYRLMALEGPEQFDKRLRPLRRSWDDDDAITAAMTAEHRRFGVLLMISLALLHTAMARTHAIQAGASTDIAQRLDAVVLGLAVGILDDQRLEKDDRRVGAARHIAVAALAYLQSEMERTIASTDWFGKGPFSSIRLSELSAIASRDEAVRKRYGERRVEHVFEQQLALVVQSFGFLVVQTRTGKRRVDLVCISPDPTDPYTVLIEAKSSRKPYALPTDDQRALKEYVEEVRRTRVTLPSLRLVLLVGPSAASTLEGKLNDLEATITTPVRFIGASDFATLRDRIAGPVPSRALRDLAIGESTRVLGDPYVESVVDAVRQTNEAHTAFVDALLARS